MSPDPLLSSGVWARDYFQARAVVGKDGEERRLGGVAGV